MTDDLEQYRQWHPYLHDLGECEVKHGVRLSVANLYTDELGNPELPEKFRAASGKARSQSRSDAKTRERRWLFIALVIVGAFIICAILWSRRELLRTATAPATSPAIAGGNLAAIPEKSIAVLPFDN